MEKSDAYGQLQFLKTYDDKFDSKRFEEGDFNKIKTKHAFYAPLP